MQEQNNEKISLLIDEELDSENALTLLRELQKNENLKEKLQRYQLISQVLKYDHCHPLDNHFSDKIRQQIDKEPVFFIPRKKTGLDWRKAGLALAASITLAVVWVTGKNDGQTHRYDEPAIAYDQSPQNQSDAMNARFNEYLQAHDNAVYINDVPRVQPYARVVGFHQE